MCARWRTIISQRYDARVLGEHRTHLRLHTMRTFRQARSQVHVDLVKGWFAHRKEIQSYAFYLLSSRSKNNRSGAQRILNGSPASLGFINLKSIFDKSPVKKIFFRPKRNILIFRKKLLSARESVQFFPRTSIFKKAAGLLILNPENAVPLG